MRMLQTVRVFERDEMNQPTAATTGMYVTLAICVHDCCIVLARTNDRGGGMRSSEHPCTLCSGPSHSNDREYNSAALLPRTLDDDDSSNFGSSAGSCACARNAVDTKLTTRNASKKIASSNIGGRVLVHQLVAEENEQQLYQ